VPVFLGTFELRDPYKQEQEATKEQATRLTRWLQFTDQLESYEPSLAHAVHGFFENGGQMCYLMPLAAWANSEIEAALEELKALDTIDLICAPGLVSSFEDVFSPTATDAQREVALQQVAALQTAILNHCDRMNDRFAILDALPRQDIDGVLRQRGRLRGADGALYYPWVGVHVPDPLHPVLDVPPCGHVAGVYARSDRQHGVHKAPANEILRGVVRLEYDLKDADQGQLNPQGVNCLRSFRGRGIRVWGARTLTDAEESEWMFVNVRRLFITLNRWIMIGMLEEVFEPNNPELWARIEYRLKSYCLELLRQGALAGAAPDEAFYVYCNAQTNTKETLDLGKVIPLVGLAPTIPAEFIEVRIIHGPAGVTLAGPGRYV